LLTINLNTSRLGGFDVDYDTNVYAAFHKALYRHSSKDAAELDAIFWQIY